MALSQRQPNVSPSSLPLARRSLRLMRPAATVYRCREGSGTWHYRSDCDGWPEDAFHVTSMPPHAHTLCPECNRLAGAAGSPYQGTQELSSGRS